MNATIQYQSKAYHIDLSKPLDISIPLRASKHNVNAWYLDEPSIAPAVLGDWVGSVESGASVNFNTITFNPHAHGTHTECVGHITKKFHSINEQLKQFFFLAEVITIAPSKIDDDFVITAKQLEYSLKGKQPEAVVIRTIPNTKEKLSQQYSNTNPPYLHEDAAVFYAKTM